MKKSVIVTAMKIGAIGSITNLVAPIISSILIGYIAGNKVVSDEKLSDESEARAIGAPAGIIACTTQQVVSILVAAILLFLLNTASPADEIGLGFVSAFIIVGALYLIVPILIISILIGAVSGAVGGYQAARPQNETNIENIPGSASVRRQSQKTQNSLIIMGILLLLALGFFWFVFSGNIFSLSSNAVPTEVDPLQYGSYYGGEYSASMGDFSCNYMNSLLSPISDNVDPKTGIGSLISVGSPATDGLPKLHESLSYFPLSSEDIAKLTTPDSRKAWNTSKATDWVNQIKQEHPASISLTSEVVDNTDDVFTEVRVVNGSSPDYSDKTKDKKIGSLIFIRGKYAYELTFVNDYIVNKNDVSVKSFLMGGYSSCTFNE